MKFAKHALAACVLVSSLVALLGPIVIGVWAIGIVACLALGLSDAPATWLGALAVPIYIAAWAWLPGAVDAVFRWLAPDLMDRRA